MGAVGAQQQTATKSKTFAESSVQEKRLKIKEFEDSLDERFKHYTFGKYKIYKIDSGNYAAYQFRELSDSAVEKATNTSYFAVLYERTLKEIKAKLEA